MKNMNYILVGVALIVGIMIGVLFFNSGESNTFQVGSSECKWENINQGLLGSSTYRDVGDKLYKGGFPIPLDLSYEEVEFTQFGILSTTAPRNNVFFLNDVECGVLETGVFELTDFTSECVNELKEGMNNFHTSLESVVIHEIYVGMRYKPANCN